MTAKLNFEQRMEAESIMDVISNNEDALREFVYAVIAARGQKNHDPLDDMVGPNVQD
jgi:hypothetical protein